MHTDKQVTTILSAIIAHPNTFSAKPELLHKAAREIVIAQLKDKSFNLERLRNLADALGRDCTLAILEELPFPTLASLIAKLDKASRPRAEEGNFAVTHLLTLALREVEPQPATTKAAKTPKAKAKPEKETVRLLHQSKALGRKS